MCINQTLCEMLQSDSRYSIFILYCSEVGLNIYIYIVCCVKSRKAVHARHITDIPNVAKIDFSAELLK